MLIAILPAPGAKCLQHLIFCPFCGNVSAEKMEIRGDILPAAFVSDPARRVEIARTILSQLPEWFGIPAATEGYITDAAHEPCFVCEKDGAPVGFLCLKETGSRRPSGLRKTIN